MQKQFKLALACAIGALLSTSALANTSKVGGSVYSLDQSHTFVTFEIGHFGTSTNRGRFDRTSGEVYLNPSLKIGSINATIDATSINTGWPKFLNHLRSHELLNVEKFSTIDFKSNKFDFNGEKVTSIQGDLTFLGVTQPVTLTAKNYNCFLSPMLKKEVCGGDFETVLDRSQFGLNYGINFGFPKEVKIVIQVEAVKKDDAEVNK